MQVLGIMGSTRRGSNTELLLDSTLSGAESLGAETVKIVVSERDIRPCMELYHCALDGTCSIRDDMQQLYGPLATADCVVLASPIFFYGLTSQAKALGGTDCRRGDQWTQAVRRRCHDLEVLLRRNRRSLRGRASCERR
jgi:NAD(P)H-dependent FMN reductase